MVRRSLRPVLERAIPVLLSALVLLLGACSPSPTPSPASSTRTNPPSPDLSPGASPTSCILPKDSNSHVYHPDRLTVLADCVTVDATLKAVVKEADGDLHLRVQPDAADLDPKGGHWINQGNVTGEHGYLVVEPVCVNKPTQADAVSACSGYTNPLVIPPVGTHVALTGPWVLDVDHGWLEIHPLTALEVLP